MSQLTEAKIEDVLLVLEYPVGTNRQTAEGEQRASASFTRGPKDLEVARHTHPGIESGYLLEGGIDLPIQGQPTRTLKPGDGFQVPAETPHAGAKNGDKKTVLAVTYVVEKGKPLASPA